MIDCPVGLSCFKKSWRSSRAKRVVPAIGLQKVALVSGGLNVRRTSHHSFSRFIIGNATAENGVKHLRFHGLGNKAEFPHSGI